LGAALAVFITVLKFLLGVSFRAGLAHGLMPSVGYELLFGVDGGVKAGFSGAPMLVFKVIVRSAQATWSGRGKSMHAPSFARRA